MPGIVLDPTVAVIILRESLELTYYSEQRTKKVFLRGDICERSEKI